MRLFILALLLFSACGKYKASQTTVGLQRAFNPLVVNGEERDRIISLCGVLRQKAGLLPQVINSNYTFGFAQKSCDDKKLGVESTVEVTIQRPFSNFLFKRKFDNSDFYYSDVETDTTGTMGTICQSIDNLTSPMKLGNANAIWFTTTNISTSDCSNTGDEQCVLVETGSLVGDVYKIHTQEWIKFRINRNLNNLGFFTEKKTISTAMCAQDKFIESHAVLRK